MGTRTFLRAWLASAAGFALTVLPGTVEAASAAEPTMVGNVGVVSTGTTLTLASQVDGMAHVTITAVGQGPQTDGARRNVALSSRETQTVDLGMLTCGSQSMSVAVTEEGGEPTATGTVLTERSTECRNVYMTSLTIGTDVRLDMANVTDVDFAECRTLLYGGADPDRLWDVSPAGMTVPSMVSRSMFWLSGVSERGNYRFEVDCTDPSGQTVYWNFSETFTITETYDDVPLENMFFHEIEWISYHAVARGWEYGDGRRDYRPYIPINRDAMAAFLYRYATWPEYTAPDTSPFSDVAVDSQFYKEICWLADTGISTGWIQADGTRLFRPTEPINRDAMAAFLYRFAQVNDYTPPATSPFSDVTPDIQFYREMSWLAETGISRGFWDGTYRPWTPINRDAMAAYLFRFDTAVPS